MLEGRGRRRHARQCGDLAGPEAGAVHHDFARHLALIGANGGDPPEAASGEDLDTDDNDSGPEPARG